MKSKVFNCDCLKIMKDLSDNKFDLAIVDPPYGIDGNSHRKNLSRGKYTLAKSYDNSLWSQTIPTQEYFDQLFRVSKNQIIFGINYFVGCRDLPIGGGRIIWDKVNGTNNFSDAEIAYNSQINSVRIFPFMWNGMQQGKSFIEGKTLQGNKNLNEKRIHPTQKPVELYKYLLDNYSAPGDLILDTHLGSGSSRIAAYQLEREFIGIELVEKYYKDQEKRFKEFISQFTLDLKTA